MTTPLYTVVQHSAWTAKQDPQFERGLEVASINDRQAEKVRALGGLVFDSWVEADDWADAEMYPEGYTLLTPIAPGTFTKHNIAKIEGRPIYVPKSTRRHDEDGQPYIAYFRNDVIAGFIWSGRQQDPVQVSHEMGEPIIDTFMLKGGGAPHSLADFKRDCDDWLEGNH